MRNEQRPITARIRWAWTTPNGLAAVAAICFALFLVAGAAILTGHPRVAIAIDVVALAFGGGNIAAYHYDAHD